MSTCPEKTPRASCWSFLIQLSSDSMNVKTTLIWKHIKYLYLFWLYEFKVKIKCRTEFMTQIWAEKHETQSCRPHRSFMSTNKVSINFWQQQLISLFVDHIHSRPSSIMQPLFIMTQVTLSIFPSASSLLPFRFSRPDWSDLFVCLLIWLTVNYTFFVLEHWTFQLSLITFNYCVCFFRLSSEVTEVTFIITICSIAVISPVWVFGNIWNLWPEI